MHVPALRMRRSAPHFAPSFNQPVNEKPIAVLVVAIGKPLKANDWSPPEQAPPLVAVGSQGLTQQAPVQQASHRNGATPGKAQSALPSCQSGAAAAGYGSRYVLLLAPARSTAGPWSSGRPQRGAGGARRVIGNPPPAGLPSARPNPSLKLTRYGRRCKPGLRYSVHSLSPGLQHLPPRAA
jgi:hypothetical protein